MPNPKRKNLKRCRGCKAYKKLADYYLTKKRVARARCKACTIAEQKIRNKRVDPQKESARAMAWRKRNPRQYRIINSTGGRRLRLRRKERNQTLLAFIDPL